MLDCASMSKKKKSEEGEPETRRKTPTFLLELPLQVTESQAKRIRAHLEAGRAFYNAVLSEGNQRLRQMRADPAWQAARAIPRSHKPERQAAFSALRQQYGFSEYALHEYAKQARVSRAGQIQFAQYQPPFAGFVALTAHTTSNLARYPGSMSRYGMGNPSFTMVAPISLDIAVV